MYGLRTIALTTLLINAGAVIACAQQPQSYWGDWQQHPQKNYFYRNFYFRPTADAANYRHNKVLWVPGSQYFYYYSPYMKKVWGRCSVHPAKQNVYYALPPQLHIHVENSNNVNVTLGNNNQVQQTFSGITGGQFQAPMAPGVNASSPPPVMGPCPDDPPPGCSFPPPV